MRAPAFPRSQPRRFATRDKDLPRKFPPYGPNGGRAPSPGQPDSRREAGAPVSHEAMQCFTLINRRDTEASFCQLVALETIVEYRAVMGTHVGVDVPQSLEHLVEFFLSELSRRIDDAHILPSPAANLLHFFFQRHAGKKVRDAIFDGKLGISIGGRFHLGF